MATAEEGKQLLLSTNIDGVGKKLLEQMFAAYHDKSSNQYNQATFKMDEKIQLSPSEYKYVKETITTTLGILFFNRYVLEKTNIIQFIGYWNTPLTEKSIGKLDAAVNMCILRQQITTRDLGNYVDSRDKLGYWACPFTGSTITSTLLDPMEDVNKRKRELFKQYENDLNSDSAVTQLMASNKIEKELLDMANNNLLKDKHGGDLYASGVGNLENQYKTINVMRGAVFNEVTKRYDVVENSLMDGMDKHALPAQANAVVAGAYPSAVATAKAGYLSKQILAVLQSEHLDPNPNSDCGTEATIPLTVNETNTNYVIFRYIKLNGKKFLITPDNVDQFLNKTIDLYSPMGCKHTAICGKCAGTLFHNLGVTNVGLLATQVSQKLLNLGLKAKHAIGQSATILSLDKLFLEKNDHCYIDGAELKNKQTMKLFIPRMKDDEAGDTNLLGFERQSTSFTAFGIMPVKFYDKNDNEIYSSLLTIPGITTFHLYTDMQETPDNYIVTYEPDSSITRLDMRQTHLNVQYFLNQIYLYSKTPQIPYNLMTEMMFKCLENNKTDLTGPSIIYELLARRTCRYNGDTFAKAYGNNPNIDQMSYEKLNFRTCVQKSGVLQGMLFEDVTKSLQTGLASTLNGETPETTPLEKLIRA